MRKKRRVSTAAASRPALSRATVLVTVVLLALAASALGVRWAFDTSAGEATASSALTCSVESTACAGDEVEVFRMSSTANAHAGTPTGSSYTYRVCCGSVAALGLGTNCSGTYDTVVALSGTDNAHAATTVGGAYTTEACLSVTEGAVACTHTSDCGTAYECLATISDTTNAHVADCDGTDDYATKVCCSASLSMPVGGMAELPDASDSSGRNYMALTGLAAAALIALTAGAWYARRRWMV